MPSHHAMSFIYKHYLLYWTLSHNYLKVSDICVETLVSVYLYNYLFIYYTYFLFVSFCLSLWINLFLPQFVFVFFFTRVFPSHLIPYLPTSTRFVYKYINISRYVLSYPLWKLHLPLILLFFALVIQVCKCISLCKSIIDFAGVVITY